MASVNKDSKGWRVLFVDPNGKRKQIRPGKGTNKATAEQIGVHVDHLVTFATSRGTLNRQTSVWLGEIGDKLHAKLASAGLIEPRTPKAPEPAAILKPVVELGTFLAEYRADGLTHKGKQAAELTVVKWRAPMNGLIQFFGFEKDIATITLEDAYQYRKWLDQRRIKKSKKSPNGHPLTENTKRKQMDNAKVFFNGAIRRGLIADNPFKHQVSTSEVNRKRDYHLMRQDTDRIIEVCPDAQWRLLVALWRYAGLRKMEVFQLTWGDVLWDQGKMRVHAPKTKHHEGKELRYVPLRDIRQYLQEAYQAALPAGTLSLPADTPIITRFTATNSNLDKPFKSILHRAGLVPWPKLFQNMRASCETAWLDEGHVAHVVAAWIGHSVKVQRDSYAQLTDGHFEKFNNHPVTKAKSGTVCGTVSRRSEENGGEYRVPLLAKHEKTPKNQCFPGFQVAAEGFEPPTRGL
jgi:integrase